MLARRGALAPLERTEAEASWQTEFAGRQKTGMDGSPVRSMDVDFRYLWMRWLD